MRKKLFTSAVAILALGSVVFPATADAKGGGGHVRKVRMQDRCDPATFNATFGDGVCIPHGGKLVKVDKFLAKLNPVDFGHEDWNFHPDGMDLKSGDSIQVVVRGGEVHSFTEVPAFGPGCLDLVNGALGLTSPRPTDAECFGPGGIFDTTGVAPNGQSTLTVSGLAPGTHLFMCFIHPWMRSVVTVDAKD
jgi:plastocyanin